MQFPAQSISLVQRDARMTRARCGGKSKEANSVNFTSVRRKTGQQSERSQIKLACKGNKY